MTAIPRGTSRKTHLDAAMTVIASFAIAVMYMLNVFNSFVHCELIECNMTTVVVICMPRMHHCTSK